MTYQSRVPTLVLGRIDKLRGNAQKSSKKKVTFFSLFFSFSFVSLETDTEKPACNHSEIIWEYKAGHPAS